MPTSQDRCPNCPDGYDCSTGNYWTPVKVDNPTIGQALCLDDIHEADGSCCTWGRDQMAEASHSKQTR